MRTFHIAILIFFMIFGFTAADETPNYDYFFLFDGGVFIHETGQPYEAFTHFSIPPKMPYSNIVQMGDMTSDGVLIAVLKGDNEHESRIDLVRIDPDLKLTPMFALIKREKLADGLKVDRFFGNLDIDPQDNAVIFSVIERFSKIGATTEADYSSKVYRVPLKGGSCETIGEFDSECKAVSAGGGIAAVTIPTELPSGQLDMIKMLPPDETAWLDINVQDLDIKSIDLSDDGKSLILLGKAPSKRNPYKLLRIKTFGESGVEVDMLDEFSQTDVGNDYRHSLSGDSIIFRRKCDTPWGETWVNFLLNSDSVLFPLVRSDLQMEYTPLKSSKTDEIVHSLALISDTANSIQANGKIQRCGSNGDEGSLFIDIIDESLSARVLDCAFNELKSCDIGSDNNLHGIYYENESLFSIAQIELGERLLSFESISYGKLIEHTSSNDTVQYDIHLAWNIGGRMLGIVIPENNMCIGGDDDNLHLVLHYPSKGVFPVSDYFTPLYMLNRDNWMIEHPRYLPKANETSCYFVRSFEDDDGNLYLLDSLHSRIVKYSANRKKLSELGWLPENMPPLAFPTDMALHNDNLYILDPINSRVVVFTLDGKPIQDIYLDSDHASLDNTLLGKIDETGISIVNLDDKVGMRFDIELS